jgi:PKD repeat protein
MVALIAMSVPLLGPAAAQGDEPPLEWGEDIRLSESREMSDDPTIALTPDGGLAIAWRERLAGRYSVFFAVLDGDGEVVGGRQQLGENLSASMDPSLVVDSRGRLHFVWTALEDQELWYARTAPDGDIEIGPLRLTEADGDSAESSLWRDRRDHLHLVWFDGRDGATSLYYMQLDEAGVKVVPDTRLVEVLSEQESAIAMDSSGDLHIAWNGPAPPSQLQWNYELHYTKVSSRGEVLVRDRLVATSRGTLGFPDMALDLRDHVHLVWPTGVGFRETVMYAEMDTSGRTVVEPIEASSGTLTGARDVAIAVDGNDRLHLVWSEGPTQAGDIVYMTMAPGGEPIDAPATISEAVGDSREPAIGLSVMGDPRVVWSDLRSGNAEVYLKVASRPRAGVDLAVYSRDITLDPPTVVTGHPFDVTVTVHNHGDAVSPASELAILVDMSELARRTVPAVRAGEEVDVVVSLSLDEGEHTLRAVVDPDGRLEEEVEHNNAAERGVRAYRPGTLEADAGPDIANTVGGVTYLDGAGTVYLGSGVLSFHWDFGDGSATGVGEYVEHVYSSPGARTVTLRVSDGTIEDTDTCLVDVRERDDPPRAVIDPAGHIVADRLNAVTFSSERSWDDNGVHNVSWDLGDGTTSTSMVVTHTFTVPGFYVVKLTVTDTGDLIDINRTTVEVVNLPPEVISVVEPGKVKADEEVAFSVDYVDRDGQVTLVGWDFDVSDGITFEKTGSLVTHSFEEEGRYNVTLILRDNDGGQTVVHLDVEVEGSSSSGIPGPGAVLAAAALLLATAVSTSWERHRLDKKPYQSSNKTTS